MAKRRMINWDTQPLGRMPDSALANMLGVSSYAVVKQRVKRGIPATREHLNRERVRSAEDWFGLEFANGERCARCGHEKIDTRVDWEDIGFVCIDCFLHAPACAISGCDNIALANGICRSHYVGDTWTREDYRALAEHLGHYGNNNRIYPEPGAGYKKEDFMAKIPKKPKNNHEIERERLKMGLCVECGKYAFAVGDTRCQGCIDRGDKDAT